MQLPVVNLEEAKFDCVYPDECEGLCCTHGRPGLTPEERRRIDSVLPTVLEMVRPAARKLIEKEGYVSRRTKMGHPMARVIDGWCIFFEKGCVLHKIGAAEGDKYRYKPIICSLFPLEQAESGEWYVREPDDEDWDLPCMNCEVSKTSAKKSLAEEIAHAEKLIEAGTKGPYRFESGENA